MILNRILLPLFVVGLLSAADPKYTISTLAGSRPLGDGGTATAALVASPNGVAVDDAGNLYVADVLYHRVRKITPDGRISTVLGTDSGAEPNPELLASQSPGGSPFAVALDKEGNLFVGTSTRIVKVDTDGKLTLIAGGGSSVADGAKATSARIADLRDLAFDGAGNLHYVDFGLNLVRKISADGLVTTVAGNPNGVEPFSGDGGPAKVATLNGPKGIIFDSLGNLFITDYNNGRIRKVGLNGIITTFAGKGDLFGELNDGGPALNAAMQPYKMAFDRTGQLYFTDLLPATVRVISADGKINRYAGTSFGLDGDGGPALLAKMNLPLGITFDRAGNLYIGDANNGMVRKVSPQGLITRYAGRRRLGGDGGQALDALLNFPTNPVVDGRGNVVVADQINQMIRKIDGSGIISRVAGTGEVGYSGDGGQANSAKLNSPRGLTYDRAGNLLITEYGNFVIRKVTPQGVITTIAGDPTAPNAASLIDGPALEASIDPAGMAFDSAGTLYFTSNFFNQLRKLTADGKVVTVAGTGDPEFKGDGGPALKAGLSAPTGIVIDGQDNIYIADTGNSRIRKIDKFGKITTIAGTGKPGYFGDGGQALQAQLTYPVSVALDAAGNLFLVDTGDSVVRRIGTDGVITTIAGTGRMGRSGDGGTATSVDLELGEGLAIGAKGELYVVDTSDRIRVLIPVQ